ncbi:MAG: hypothetical protein J6U66_10260, partial [Lachnospiraceae bacterium]|nr:hypothetical protein [Lachnospiraceae bacterium]
YEYYYDQMANYGSTFSVPSVPATMLDAATGETLSFVGWQLNGGTNYSPGSVPTTVTQSVFFVAIYN